MAEDSLTPIGWNEKRYQETLEALADVAAGRFVDHDAVRAWADAPDTTSLPQTNLTDAKTRPSDEGFKVAVKIDLVRPWTMLAKRTGSA
jgi:hypothetical protein